MEVILLQDVEKLGTRGQVVKVADGLGVTISCQRKWPWLRPPKTRNGWGNSG